MVRRILAACLVLLLIPAASLAEQDEIQDFAELDLEEMLDEVFSASKHRQSIIWSPSAITVFTKEDIHSSGATSLTDLLRRVPGFDIFEIKPSNPLVGARALTTNSNNLVLMIVDGREDLVELSGFALWASLTFDLSEIERIEVIRGPGSSLYGANAFAAVVSITTIADKPDSFGNLELSAGDHGQHHLFGRVRDEYALGSGSLDFGVGAGIAGRLSPSDRDDQIVKSHLRTHGYLRYRQAEELDVSLQAGYMEAEGILYLLKGGLRASSVINHWVMGKLDTTLNDWIRLKTQLYHDRNRAAFQFRSSLSAYGVWMANIPFVDIDTNTVDGQVQLDLKFSDQLMLIWGGNLRYTSLNSGKIYMRDDDEFRGAGFVHVQWAALEALQLTGGLRLDLNTDTKLALSPRAVVVFRPWDRHAFRLGYALAFRKPAFFESRVHVVVDEDQAAFPEIIEVLREQFGNEDLKNEVVHSFEAGWRAHLLDDKLRLSLDLFFNLYSNKIFFEVDVPLRLGLPDVSRADIQYQNSTDEFQAIGGEAEVTWLPRKHLVLWVNLALRRVANLDGGERVETEPGLRINLGGRYRFDFGLFVDAALHYLSSFTSPLVDPDNSLSPETYTELGGTTLLVSRLGFQLAPGANRSLELGMTLRTPLGVPFREYAGTTLFEPLTDGSFSDFGGEYLVRLINFYLRAAF